MIHFVARYELLTDNMDAIDSKTDRMMEALLGKDDVEDPDIAVSLTEKTLEIGMVFDTVDALTAIDQGVAALRSAFDAAGLELPTASVFAHDSLIGAPSDVRAELVSA